MLEVFVIRLGGVSFTREHLKVEFESPETSAVEQFIVQLRCAVVSATRQTLFVTHIVTPC